MSRFANLADKPKSAVRSGLPENSVPPRPIHHEPDRTIPSRPPPSRIGRKAIAAYFSPEMSLAMHLCARKQGISLQTLMAEAFDDVLRKYGESPVGG